MIVLYDGTCGLCHRTVRFVLARDRAGRCRFAALQGPVAAAILARHGRDPADLDTFYLVLDPDTPSERLFDRGRGMVELLARLGGPWRAMRAFRILPRFILDGVYRFIARRRYRIFGRVETCAMARPEYRARFLDPV